MKRLLIIVIILMTSTIVMVAQPPVGKTWKLKYEDNFDGSLLDTTKWSFGFGWGLNSGSFDEKNRKENLSLKNGMAIFKGESIDSNKYFSAAINTRNKMIMKHGYWEIRAKISKNVSGCDFGFWQKLNSDKWPPELDIYEFMGIDPAQSLNIHWSDSGHKEAQEFFNGGDMTLEFHVYGLEFTNEYIRWWTDGKIVREIKKEQFPKFFTMWESDAAYTILNIHLSDRYKQFGLVDSKNLPVFMYIDYFRMYENANN